MLLKIRNIYDPNRKYFLKVNANSTSLDVIRKKEEWNPGYFFVEHIISVYVSAVLQFCSQYIRKNI